MECAPRVLATRLPGVDARQAISSYSDGIGDPIGVPDGRT
jgi:hypothetical protein